MAPKVVLKRLTAEKVIEQVDFPVACDLCFLGQCQRKISGPKVDIYVGPKSKHYRVPKDILCYNSTYFDRCFNGQVKEAKEQKLSLPEDRPEFFQIRMDYIFSDGENERNLKTCKFGTWNGCIAFMEYAEVYDLAGAVEAIT
jgi:hypothetical protein